MIGSTRAIRVFARAHWPGLDGLLGIRDAKAAKEHNVAAADESWVTKPNRSRCGGVADAHLPPLLEGSVSHGTVGGCIDSLLGSRECPDWPPDVFAVAASILTVSGAYERVVRLNDDPKTKFFKSGWSAAAKAVGEAWREIVCTPNSDGVPAEVSEAWTVLVSCADERLGDLSDDVAFNALALIAYADEASWGMGLRVPPTTTPNPTSHILHQAKVCLMETNHRSLCRTVLADIGAVLPKQHVPQRGLTLRSLSHNLALIPPTGVVATWPFSINPGKRVASRLDTLHILVVPWPKYIHPKCFSVSDIDPGPSREYGYFDFKHPGIPDLSDRLDCLLKAAIDQSGDVDIVVMPELALSSNELEEATIVCLRYRCALICGVAVGEESPTSDEASPESIPAHSNNAVTNISLLWGFDAASWQLKHHRWCLDAAQVAQYGLPGMLPGPKSYWERSEVGQRTIRFHTIQSWLTIATLVCEDLARQEPMAGVIRAVGPNLVFALLMDGPQIPNRWSARYATVLAEDPGCSVLALTSLGMCNMAKESARQRGHTDRSGAIAIWREASGQEVVIDLPPGSEGALLYIRKTTAEEYTADGRGDDGKACFPKLTSWAPVYVSSTKGTQTTAKSGTVVPTVHEEPSEHDIQ